MIRIGIRTMLSSVMLVFQERQIAGIGSYGGAG